MKILHNADCRNRNIISMDDIFTPDELAQYLKITRRTVYAMLEKGDLPFAFKVKGSWRFKHSDIDNWIEQQKQLATVV